MSNNKNDYITKNDFSLDFSSDLDLNFNLDKQHIKLIEEAFEMRKLLNKAENTNLKLSLKNIISNVLNKLEHGLLRVAYKENKFWKINIWVKKAILISFIINDNQLINGNFNNYFDKFIPRFHNADFHIMESIGSRIVPPASIRKGAYIAPNTIIMPSFINIGAFVDEGTMVDSWVTVGSGAQIGKNVHLSAGVNIGGVLEPIQDQPTIIEDNCFIGANSAIVEGVIIEQNSVIGMGVMLSKSTKIYDRNQGTISYGKIPQGSVVVPGTLINDNNQPSEIHTHKYDNASNNYSNDFNYKFSYNKHAINCAIIVKKVDHKTLLNTSINEILRY